jgi:hypothetical protein
LLLSRNFLEPRGWKSADVIHRAKQELLEAEFIFETVKGRRPNRARAQCRELRMALLGVCPLSP